MCAWSLGATGRGGPICMGRAYPQLITIHDLFPRVLRLLTGKSLKHDSPRASNSASSFLLRGLGTSVMGIRSPDSPPAAAPSSRQHGSPPG